MTPDSRAPGPQADPLGGSDPAASAAAPAAAASAAARSTESLKDRIRETESELAATHGRLQHYQSLLQDLPEIFERKFRERLQPIAERNRLLAEEGAVLRDQIARTLPPAPLPPEPAVLPAAGQRPADRGLERPGKRLLDRAPQRAPEPHSERAAGPATSGPSAVAGSGGGAPRAGVPIGGIALALGVCALLIGGVALVQSSRRPAAEPSPAAAARATLQPRAGLLLLSTTGPSWIQVRTIEGQELYVGTLEGTRRFSIGRGLEVRSGRPDLVRLRLGLEPSRPLGPIEAIQWHRILPAS